MNWTGPEEFAGGDWWTDDYVLEPYGLYGAEIVLTSSLGVGDG